MRRQYQVIKQRITPKARKRGETEIVAVIYVDSGQWDGTATKGPKGSLVVSNFKPVPIPKAPLARPVHMPYQRELVWLTEVLGADKVCPWPKRRAWIPDSHTKHVDSVYRAPFRLPRIGKRRLKRARKEFLKRTKTSM